PRGHPRLRRAAGGLRGVGDAGAGVRGTVIARTPSVARGTRRTGAAATALQLWIASLALAMTTSVRSHRGRDPRPGKRGRKRRAAHTVGGDEARRVKSCKFARVAVFKWRSL